MLIRFVALATLAGARDETEAEAIFDLENSGEPVAASRHRLNHWLRGLHKGPTSGIRFAPTALVKP